MAGMEASLLKLKTTIKKALIASDMDSRKLAGVNSFLQAPFTGTYSAQSGEVVGISKDMRDTFKRNLNQARIKEAEAQEAHEKFLKAMSAALKAMETAFEAKQGDLASNDASLGKKKEKLAASVKSKADAEEF